MKNHYLYNRLEVIKIEKPHCLILSSGKIWMARIHYLDGNKIKIKNVIHREDGPAIVKDPNRSSFWWLERQLTFEEWLQIIIDVNPDIDKEQLAYYCLQV